MRLIKDYKHIIWDWNGTLLDDRWICLEIINKMLKKRELPILDEETYKTVFGFPVQNYYHKIGFDFERESFEDLAKEYIEAYDSRSRECSLHKGVRDILKRLKEQGTSQSILSASKEKELHQIIMHFNIGEYFSHISGLRDHYAKSKVSVGEMWIKSQRIKPYDILMIGDTVHDAEVADALGIDCLLVAGGHQNAEQLGSCKYPVYDSILKIYEKLSDFL